MTRTMVRAAPVLLLVGLLAAACNGGGGDNEGAPSPSEGSPSESGVIQMEQDDFYFDPTELTGEAGQQVTVKLENEGNAAHTFTISELNVDQVVQPGEEATVTFTPASDGTFAFFCRFHRSQGVEGTLTIGGDAGSSGASGGGAGSDTAGGSIGY